ncbi:hypothetical protein FACS1894170_12710 [Planctomycetales bacterium]|nr:hypothetical protein FACS1894170_12710 [Planctomycetales bacterium]
MEQPALYSKIDGAAHNRSSDDTTNNVSGDDVGVWVATTSVSTTEIGGLALWSSTGAILSARIAPYLCPSTDNQDSKPSQSNSPFVGSYVGVSGGTAYAQDNPQLLDKTATRVSVAWVTASTNFQYKVATDAPAVLPYTHIAAVDVPAAGLDKGNGEMTTLTGVWLAKRNAEAIAKYGSEYYGPTYYIGTINGTAGDGGADFAYTNVLNGVIAAGTGRASTSFATMADGTSNSFVASEISWNAGPHMSQPWYAGSIGDAFNDPSSDGAATTSSLYYEGGVVSGYYAKLVTSLDKRKGPKTADSTQAAEITGTTAALTSNHKIINGASQTSKQTIKDAYQQTSNAGSWGSRHPSIAVFALGDGSCRTVSDSTDHNVLERFADCIDGAPVRLP